MGTLVSVEEAKKSLKELEEAAKTIRSRFDELLKKNK